MGVTEDQVLRELQARNFFAAAKTSYLGHVERWIALYSAQQAQGERRLPKEDREIIEDEPPYPKIIARLMPLVFSAVQRWEQMNTPRIQEGRPWLRYVGNACQHPEHQEKHGLLYPRDHPFWDEWYPPNSFPCLCSVTSVSRSLLERRRTEGQRSKWRTDVPVSSFQYLHPDEGFAFNVGKLSVPMKSRSSVWSRLLGKRWIRL